MKTHVRCSGYGHGPPWSSMNSYVAAPIAMAPVPATNASTWAMSPSVSLNWNSQSSEPSVSAM